MRDNPCVRRSASDYIAEAKRAAAMEAAMATYAAPEVPMVLILDGSGSMNYRFDGVRSRWSVLTDNTMLTVRRVCENKELAQSVHFTIVIFNTEEEIVCENVLAADLDLEWLEKRLRAYRPHGVTALGKTIVNAIARIDNRKAELRDKQLDYYQAIMVIASDGQPTNAEGKYSMESMSQAIHAVDERIDDGKLTVLPVGIGNADSKPEDFAVLSRLISTDAEGDIPVFVNAEDLRRYFRFIGSTVQAVGKGQDMRNAAREYLRYTPGSLV